MTGKPFKVQEGSKTRGSLLFVLEDDLLQLVINVAGNKTLINHPLGQNFGGDFSIVQHADDTLIILPQYADYTLIILPVGITQLSKLKEILQIFASSIGLKVNFNKSFLVPITVSDEKIDH